MIVGGVYVDVVGEADGGGFAAAKDVAGSIELIDCTFAVGDVWVASADGAPVSTVCALWVTSIVVPLSRSFT